MLPAPAAQGGESPFEHLPVLLHAVLEDLRQPAEGDAPCKESDAIPTGVANDQAGGLTRIGS
jgi:hypothetical protein